MIGKIILIASAILIWIGIILYEYKKGTQFNDWKELIHHLIEDFKKHLRKGF